MAKLDWAEDADGDWLLNVDGAYYGLCCIHRDDYVLRVWGWGDHQGTDDTLEEAKRTMEHSAMADAASDAARESYLGPR
jgi:hypothetical protein